MTQALKTGLTAVSEKVMSLSHQTEGIFRQHGVVEQENRNATVQRIAQNAAKHIGRLFEQVISNGSFSEQAVFTCKYEPVANTKPQKFKTSIDQFTDSHFPAIQEAILADNPFIIYASAFDINGYIPKHNKKFSQR